ncbi:hypothetical protein L204_104524 [Cryptococcus depauperatus]
MVPYYATTYHVGREIGQVAKDTSDRFCGRGLRGNTNKTDGQRLGEQSEARGCALVGQYGPARGLSDLPEGLCKI